MSRRLIWHYIFLGGLLVTFMPIAFAAIRYPELTQGNAQLGITQLPYLIVSFIGLTFVVFWVILNKWFAKDE